jgi:hypothetical protein
MPRPPTVPFILGHRRAGWFLAARMSDRDVEPVGRQLPGDHPAHASGAASDQGGARAVFGAAS